MPILLTKHYPSTITGIDEEIRRRLQQGETNSFLCVVPTKRKVRDLQREFLRMTPDHVSPAFSLFTLETLAAELHSILCTPKRFISGPVQAILIQEAIRSVKDSLQYFRLRNNRRGLPQGTLQKVVQVVNYLKGHGVYLSALYAELQASEASEHAKLNDMLVIYEEYERMLGEKYVDAAGIMKEVNLKWDTETSPQIFREHFRECKALLIFGFDEFSDPELTMVHHLSNVQGISTVISFDYHLANDNIFGHLKDNYQKILDLGFSKVPGTSERSASFQEFIAQHLFQRQDDASVMRCTHSISLMAAADRESEVELIAKIIKRLVQEKPDRDLSKICVSMYHPQRYTALFREVFDRFGVPSNITDRYNLDQSPLIVAVLSLLVIQEYNFRLTDIMRSLSSPYFDFHLQGDVIDAGNLYTVATMLKVSSGKRTWFNRIAQRLKLIQDQIQETEDEIDEARLHREERMLHKAKQDLERLDSLLERFREPLAPPEFKKRLRALLDDLHVVERIISMRGIGYHQMEKDARAYQKFISFIDEFLEILAFEGKQRVREHLAFYIERLRNALSQVRYNVRQKYGYGVYVTSFDETRGLNFDVMIIAGLVDGEFPPLYSPEVLLSTARRERLERYHLREHRYLFYQALTNFTEHVYLTIPQSDKEVNLVPSSFVDALLDIVGPDDRRESLPAKYSEGLYSHDELLKYAGSTIGRSGGQEPDVLKHFVLSKEVRETFNRMRHVIRVEESRMYGTTLPEYNGIILDHLDADARTALERFRRRIYSVTQLESYGKCPFQFFADKVLRLNVAEEVEEGLSPLERGGILHEILFEFYTQRRERNLPPLHQVDEQQFEEAMENLFSIAREKLDMLELSDVFWDVDKELILGSPTRKGILREFLMLERDRVLETSPALFEVAFGSSTGSRKNTDHTLNVEDPVIAGEVRLRGKVDRIDIGREVFTVIDYKSGTKTAKRSEIEMGISLQLPLYLYAVERIMTDYVKSTRKGVAGIYYMLKSPVKEQLGVGNREFLGKAFNAGTRNRQLTQDDAELHSIIQNAIAFVNEYVDSITRGQFPVLPKDPENVCPYCDFRTVCRIQVKSPGRMKERHETDKDKTS